MQFTITLGDNRDTLKNYPDNYFDSIITDPPYGIDFLGKSWDANTGALETYRECLRVLKPGGYILAFSAARTYHHLAVTLEQAGFEIRDQIMWIYASGFPKAQDIGRAIQKRQGVKETMSLEEYEKLTGVTNLPKGNDSFGHSNDTDGQKPAGLSGKITIPTSPEARQWAGWKTALKPAHEPIVMARKPFKGSTIDNVLRNGLGALNIDATRIPFVDDKDLKSAAYGQNPEKTFGYIDTEQQDTYTKKDIAVVEANDQGRFPSNVIGEVEGYQKYFYCPKVSRRERHCGFEQKTIPTSSGGMYDNHGTGKMYNIGTEMKTKKDPLAHIPAPFGDVKGAYVDGERMAKVADNANKDGILTSEHMAKAMGGHIIDTNRVWTPELGEFYIHGLKEEYRKWCKKNGKPTGTVGNNHPTVKPVELMKYLIRLVTPPNGKVLDPFTGSGSTGMAAVELGHEFTGCELDPRYVRIAETRIGAWNQPRSSGTTFEDLFEF